MITLQRSLIMQGPEKETPFLTGRSIIINAETVPLNTSLYGTLHRNPSGTLNWQPTVGPPPPPHLAPFSCGEGS